MLLFGFAAVACSRHWTPACDEIVRRSEQITPWMIAGGSAVFCIILAVAVARWAAIYRERAPAASLATPIISAEDAIARSLELVDPHDSHEFLKAWLHGDWGTVRSYLSADLKSVPPELGKP